MAKISEIIEELQFLSDRISTQVRTISVSLIAFIWILLLGGEKAPFEFSIVVKRQLIVIMFLAVITMLFDFLQYVFGYINTNSLRRTLEKNKKTEGEFDYTSLIYLMRIRIFWAKQIILAISIVWLGVIITWYLLRLLV